MNLSKIFISLVGVLLITTSFNIFNTSCLQTMHPNDIKELTLDNYMNDIALSYADALDHLNNHGPVRNVEKYTLADNYVPIVVQVGTRATYFKEFLRLLSVSDRINETLLIVAHDGYSKENFEAVLQYANFCRVKQIVNPISAHFLKEGIYPNKLSSLDERPEILDQYGHPRDHRRTAGKLMWWWMQNTIWEGLDELKNHSRDVLFFEEDHFVTKDFYSTLLKVIEIRNKECPMCFNINLARRQELNYTMSNKVGLQIGPYFHMGMAFNRSSWNLLRAQSKLFCEFKDSNFDMNVRGLQHLGLLPEMALTMQAWRVYHAGKCGGLNSKNVECNLDLSIQEFQKEIQQPLLNMTENEWDNYKIDWNPMETLPSKLSWTHWGGWGFTLDVQLCKAITMRYRKDLPRQ